MNNLIDHAALKPYQTYQEVQDEVKIAIDNRFRGICVLPNCVKKASKYTNNEIKLIACIGFPFGANGIDAKLMEINQSCEATEFDIVMNINAFKSKCYLQVVEELTTLVDEFEEIKTKVIVEECYLTQNEIEIAYNVVKDSGAWAIKTSTGFGKDIYGRGTTGATLETVKLWNKLNNQNKYSSKAPPLVIKASGGIKTIEQATRFIDAGANILGTSHGKEIISKD